MKSLSVVVKAADFSAKKHSRQRRMNDKTIPYINHPIEVARILADEGSVEDPVVLAAALLHDTVEDTDATIDEVAREFGEPIARVVAEVTDDKSLPKGERKRRQVTHAREISTPARLVKLADKLSNLRGLAVDPPPSWGADRVRGYFVWASFVVESIGNVNAPLFRSLEELFASEISVGERRFRAVPGETAERTDLLAAYYHSMDNL